MQVYRIKFKDIGLLYPIEWTLSIYKADQTSRQTLNASKNFRKMFWYYFFKILERFCFIQLHTQILLACLPRKRVCI